MLESGKNLSGKKISGSGEETRLKNKTERKKAIIGGGDGNSKLWDGFTD